MNKNIIFVLVGMLVIAAIPTAMSEEKTDLDKTRDVDWWPMFQHDNQNSGLSTSESPTNLLRWSEKIPGYSGSKSSPAIVDGFVYFGAERKVYCFYLTNGTEKWNYETDNIIGQSSPAVVNGSVYIGSYDGHLYSIDSENGSLNWRNPLSISYALIASPIVLGDNVYIGSLTSKIYCLNTDDGSIKWQYTLGQVKNSVALYNDRLYVPMGSRLVCLDADPFDDGIDEGNPDDPGAQYDVIWEYNSGTYIESAPAVKNDFVYYGCNNDRIYCLNIADGSLVWYYTTGADIKASPALNDDLLFVGSKDDKMYCLDADPSDGIDEGIQDPTGSDYDLVWTFTTGGDLYSSAAIAENKIYFGSFDKNVYCLNSNDGSLEWQYDLGLRVESSPGIVEGFLYITGSSSSTADTIYCFGGTNDPPGQPNISGPEEAVVDIDVSFTISTNDPDGNELIYFIDWGDGEQEEYGPFDSGESFDAIHSWNEVNNYEISVVANDGFVNGTSSIHNIEIINNIPTRPDIVGPTEGEINQKLNFTIVSEDADSHDLSYVVDWGDDSTKTYGPFESGESFYALHKYQDFGIFTILVTVTDEYGAENSSTHDIEIVNLPELDIKSIEGGTGITAVIENTGEGDATDVEWTITIEGGFFILTKEASDVIESIEAGDEAEITMSVFGIGLGILTDIPVITVSAECAEGPITNDSNNAKILLNQVII